MTNRADIFVADEADQLIEETGNGRIGIHPHPAMAVGGGRYLYKIIIAVLFLHILER